MRIPRPPPPPEAFRITGKPMRVASLSACAASVRTPLPARRGSPKRAAFVRAVTLSPQARMASGVGPMNVMPHFPQMRANSAFSERNP